MVDGEVRRPRAGSVHRVFNNNVILTIDALDREQVLMGRGLGFQMRPDDPIDYSKVEKTFVLEKGVDNSAVQEMLANADLAVVDAVTAAVHDAEARLGRHLGRTLPVAVIDHVSFLVDRLARGLRIPDAPLPELAVLYPDEYAAALAMSETIGARLGVEVPPEEAVFLTIHLLNVTRDEPNGTAAILSRRVHEIVTLVGEALGVRLEVTSADHARFVLHIKFLLQRLASGTMLESADASFYEFAKRKHPEALAVAERVDASIVAETGTALTEEEMLYLVVHIARLS